MTTEKCQTRVAYAPTVFSREKFRKTFSVIIGAFANKIQDCGYNFSEDVVRMGRGEKEGENSGFLENEISVEDSRLRLVDVRIVFPASVNM